MTLPAVIAHGGAVVIAATLFAGASTATARAQGRLEARFVATLAGLPIGEGKLAVSIGDNQYTAAASGMTTGLVRLFASGQGSSAARGAVRNGNIMPVTYASNLSSGKRSEDLRIVLNNGAVKDVTIDPPSPPQPERLPVPEAHKRGVVDPMSAVLMRVNGNGAVISQAACSRTIAIFDGRMRFDLRLSFKRIETVEAHRGYRGPVAVCAVQFVPVSGYVPNRAALVYLEKQRDIEFWLAPVEGTRMTVPIRAIVPTPFGMGVLEATQFVASAAADHAPTTARSQ